MLIDPLIPAILDHLKRARNLVLQAPPGAGKTTRVPPALLPAGGEVWVLEPRRLAARMAARRVAAELGERVGETAGYQVRFEEIAGPKTRLRFMTEGVLTRKLLSDQSLRNVATVVLDEFHERNLDGDLALALLSRLQRTTRPDLRLVVMSATMDAAPVAHFLGDCPVMRSEGREFELRISHRPHSPEPLDAQVAAAFADLLAEGLDGDALVFLPGAYEIRRAAAKCAPLAQAQGMLIAPLHGDLSPEEQDRAVLPSKQRKLILATNVAESSITIEGVTAVIDSGLARIAVDSPWTGLPSLNVGRISKASAIQRAGRAARVRAGRVIRLYPAEDFQRRPEHAPPEIMRRELSQTLLDLRAMNAGDLRWLDPPPAAAIQKAEELLRRLGALTAAGALTETGAEMAGYPLHPRLARLAIEAARRGVGRDGCALAALLSAGARSPSGAAHSGPSDLLLLIESEWDPQTRRIFQQLWGRSTNRQTGQTIDLLQAILTAFPDRVARRRQADELLLASGGAARLSRSSIVRVPLLIAIDVEERREQTLPLVRLASAIEPEWLLDLYPDRLKHRTILEWNRTAERVEAVQALLYDDLVLEESRGAAPDPEQAARLLLERAIEAGVARFADPIEIEEFLARVQFASQHAPIPALTDADVQSALASLCAGLKSFGELAAAAASGGLRCALEQRLLPGAARVLDEVAPATLQLPSGRRIKIRYKRDQPPWTASRLQDFFGLKETPRVARGNVSVVLHLLAPNQRPVQMTTDLAGFWKRLYPQLRRELSRRYPKHRWPEDPYQPEI
jgi:ATP-dependent helicase HrpB